MRHGNSFSPNPNILPSPSVFWGEHGADCSLKEKRGRKIKMDIGLFGVLTDNDTGKTGFVVFPVASGNLSGLRLIRNVQGGVRNLAGRIGLCPALKRNGRTTDHENDAHGSGSLQKGVYGVTYQLSHGRATFFRHTIKGLKKTFRDKHADSLHDDLLLGLGIQ